MCGKGKIIFADLREREKMASEMIIKNQEYLDYFDFKKLKQINKDH